MFLSQVPRMAGPEVTVMLISTPSERVALA
jgi:hypothetical protein